MKDLTNYHTVREEGALGKYGIRASLSWRTSKGRDKKGRKFQVKMHEKPKTSRFYKNVKLSLNKTINTF